MTSGWAVVTEREREVTARRGQIQHTAGVALAGSNDFLLLLKGMPEMKKIEGRNRSPSM